MRAPMNRDASKCGDEQGLMENQYRIMNKEFRIAKFVEIGRKDFLREMPG